jgi:predicted O-methyltransferase YrrM
MDREQEINQLRRENSRLTRLVQKMKESIDEVVELQDNHRLIVLDYPVKPRVRFGGEQPSLPPMVEYLDSRKQAFLSYVDQLTELLPIFEEIAMEEGAPFEPHWNNIWFNASDAAMLCAFLAKHRPKTYLEIGSGHSTLFARWLIKRLDLPTRIISIDPQPRVGIDTLCDQVIRQPLEELDLEVFETLEENDILFYDGSHRSFQNSDVTVFFLEVLPKLASGVVWHIHDIFLPQDYPEEWQRRFYNEQYLLAAALLAGATRYNVSFANSYMPLGAWLKEALSDVTEHPRLSALAAGGGSFWLQMS